MAGGEVTKMVSGRAAISSTVLGSVSVHAPVVAPLIEKALFPGGAPADLSVEVFLAALGRALESSVQEIKDADIAHTAELSDDAAVRETRDSAINELRAVLIDSRDLLSVTYGPGILAAYGLEGETPTSPLLASQRAKNTAGLLRTEPIKDKPRRVGVKVDVAALASELEMAANRVGDALGTVEHEEREAQLTLNARNDALVRWNARYQGVADTITGLYELAEKWDLAGVVRPTSRRRGGLPEDGDPITPPPVDPTGPTPAEPTGPTEG